MYVVHVFNILMGVVNAALYTSSVVELARLTES